MLIYFLSCYFVLLKCSLFGLALETSRFDKGFCYPPPPKKTLSLADLCRGLRHMLALLKRIYIAFRGSTGWEPFLCGCGYTFMSRGSARAGAGQWVAVL